LYGDDRESTAATFCDFLQFEPRDKVLTDAFRGLADDDLEPDAAFGCLLFSVLAELVGEAEGSEC